MVLFQGFVKPTLLVSFEDAPLYPFEDCEVARALTKNIWCGDDMNLAQFQTNNLYQPVLISATIVLHGSRIGIPPTVANDYNIDLYELQGRALA